MRSAPFRFVNSALTFHFLLGVVVTHAGITYMHARIRPRGQALFRGTYEMCDLAPNHVFESREVVLRAKVEHC